MRGNPVHSGVTGTGHIQRERTRTALRSADAGADASIPAVSAIVSHLQQLRAAVSEPDSAAEALGAVLIGGQNPAAMARAAGIAIAEEYAVLALALPPENPAHAEHVRTDAHRLTRIRRAVSATCGAGTLPLLGALGGTVLIPADDLDDPVPSALLVRLRQAARGPVSMVAVPSLIDSIPQSTQLAHELLDVVHRLRYAPGMYRFEDLTLEYQLTRPGAATEHLSRTLEPIVGHPDLVKTLRQHIDNNFHRQQTARALNIHSNTVDYRLRRVKDLTGLDPYRLTDLWHLQSALVAHMYRHTDPESRHSDIAATLD
ncbi:putative transcriptional regulator [Nocardia nova SH22a]|uniref:Putative transcriptional regulator n=1 Tax=Nocardia nova SH22a TaxID=1415166 RepID=W5TKT0_9NOCA|nr:helix-turn-helix domain-containing protein [Nocardia nova]AHH19573.1 putative transcriptional regulator [Nocardia nova SH22a]